MKNILKAGIFLLVFVLATSSDVSAQAQKFGYLNSSELILLLPEAKVADKDLETYQKQLAAAFQKKVEKFQQDVAAFEKAAPELAPIKQQEQGTALQKRQEELGKEEQGLQTKIGEKRNELLKPILEKVDTAIKAVGKEGGYTMIFDSSGMNVMLYHDTSTDVMALVKAKLNL